MSTVFDVGANAGQFALSLRNEGFVGRIVSFEPLRAAFSDLSARCAAGHNWECHNFALGESRTTAVLNVSANSYSSSLLQVTERALTLEPSIGYVTSEEIPVVRLDEVLDSTDLHERTLLKIDTQGFELEVLKGAGRLLPLFDMIQLEAAWLPSYHGQPSVDDLVKWLGDKEFGVLAVEPCWTDS